MSLEEQIRKIVEDLVQQKLEQSKPRVNKYSIHINELSEMTGITVVALKGRRNRGTLKLINTGNELLVAIPEVKRFLKTLGLVYQD